VAAPTKHDYTIEVNLVLYESADQTKTVALVNDALTALVNTGLNKLGKDVVKSQIAAAAIIDDLVYSVGVVTPSSDYVADDNVYTNCTGITINVTGTAHG
jgi:phage-related baseplate assembly protein